VCLFWLASWQPIPFSFSPIIRLTCSCRAAGRTGCFFRIFGCSSCPSSDFDGLLPLIYDVRNYQRKCHHHQKQPSRPSQQPGSEAEGVGMCSIEATGGGEYGEGTGLGTRNWELRTGATPLGKQWAGQCQGLRKKSNPCGINCGPAPGWKCNVWELLRISPLFSQFQAFAFTCQGK